jgi:hypothetical protein
MIFFKKIIYQNKTQIIESESFTNNKNLKKINSLKEYDEKMKIRNVTISFYFQKNSVRVYNDKSWKFFFNYFFN